MKCLFLLDLIPSIKFQILLETSKVLGSVFLYLIKLIKSPLLSSFDLSPKYKMDNIKVAATAVCGIGLATVCHISYIRLDTFHVETIRFKFSVYN